VLRQQHLSVTNGVGRRDRAVIDDRVWCAVMGALGKIQSWRSKIFLWVGLPVIAVIGLAFGSVDVLPAWEAKTGGGTTGTFTAVREDCGRRSCSFYGDWVSADGGQRRTDVIVYDEPDSLQIGGQTEAVDTGARKGVFATAGGLTYLLVTGLTLAGLAAAVGWVVFLVRTFRRRSAAAQPTALAR
jgi:hypothetical protein